MLLAPPRIVEHLAAVAPVRDLVVVPLVDLRHGGRERAEGLVLQVVRVLAAVLVERLRDDRLRRRDEVVPGAAARQRDGGGERHVRVDRVAAEEEEVAADRGHRAEDAVAARSRVDAPALASEVAAPEERHAPRVRRGRPDRPLRRLRHDARCVQVLEAHPERHAGARRESAQDHLPGVVALRPDHRAAHPHAGAVAQLHPHARGPVGPGPHDAAVRRDVARLHAVRHERAVAGERGRGARRIQASGQRAEGEPAARRQQVSAAKAGARGHPPRSTPAGHWSCERSIGSRLALVRDGMRAAEVGDRRAAVTVERHAQCEGARLRQRAHMHAAAVRLGDVAGDGEAEAAAAGGALA